MVRIFKNFLFVLFISFFLILPLQNPLSMPFSFKAMYLFLFHNFIVTWFIDPHLRHIETSWFYNMLLLYQLLLNTSGFYGPIRGDCMFVILKFYKIKISFSVKFSIVVFNFKKMLQNKQQNKSIWDRQQQQIIINNQ